MGNLETERIDTAAVANRQMARRLFAGVKMLVKPVAGGGSKCCPRPI
jgi:hypothetical protein